MRTLLGCGLVLALACGVASGQEKKGEKIDGKKLIGKWEPKDGQFVIEFAKEGKVTFTFTKGPVDEAVGTYKLEGNKLMLTVSAGGKEQKMSRTVSKLTDTELVSSDDNKGGKEDTLTRVKEEKKDKKDKKDK